MGDLIVEPAGALQKPQDCRRCYKDGIPGALYVGESARSGNERMGEHIEDTRSQRTESRLKKHWSLIVLRVEKLIKESYQEFQIFFHSPVKL